MEHHDVSLFDCQNTYLNYYLKEKALEETTHDLSRTFVLLDRITSSKPALVGYFTLRADSYYFSTGGSQDQTIIPVVELIALARHISRRGEGIGDYLLIEALRNVVEAAEHIGIAGIHLSYTAEGKTLYERYNFGQHPSYGAHLLFLPITHIRQIVSEIDTATG